MNTSPNNWYVASWSKDLAVGEPLAMQILGRPLVLWRGPQGEVSALDDRCVHRLAPLSRGRCEGAKLRCRYHGMVFAPGGDVVEIPGQDEIPARARARAYPVVERHSWIWVWMGDPARADPDRIPAMVGLDDENYYLGAGTLDFAADAQLVRDNLLDFSHISYLHADSFALGDAYAKVPPRIVELPDGLQYQRWLENQELMPGNAMLVDQWSNYSFRAPGIITMATGAYPLGTARALDRGVPDPSLPGMNITFTNQAITPMSDRSTRYFFSWGPRRDCGTPELAEQMMALAYQAFTEDKEMVEAQQRMIDLDPSFPMLGTHSDVGVFRFNARLREIEAAEAAEADGRVHLPVHAGAAE